MASQPSWARPPQVALIILAYFLIHVGVRVWAGPTLGLDDAEQALFAQQWLLNYRLRAPPLFTWALVGAGSLVGINALVIAALRYALLAMVAAFTYLTARALIRDPRLAALATFSFAAIYVFGYYSHHDLTHTTVLAAFIAASWYAFVRLVELPTLGRYLALGAAFGFGLLGKWNFLIFALALPAACLTEPQYRRLVINWRMLPAVASMVLIALPSALWAVDVGPATGDGMASLLGKPAASLFGGLVVGTANLALAVFAYPMPLLAIFLVLFGAAAWRGFRLKDGPPEPVVGAGLIGKVMVIALLLHWLLVPFAGATMFSERLLQPALQILPIYLFMLVDRVGADERPVRGYALAMAAVAVIAVAARLVVHIVCPGACRALIPFEEVAQSLRRAGFAGTGTILVAEFHLGGNLRVQFPKARVIDIGFPPRVWPAAPGQGQCLLVWPARSSIANAFDDYLVRELAVSATTPRREGSITVAVPATRARSYQVFYRLYAGSPGECR